PLRVQGCFLSDAETERVVNYIAQHTSVKFDPNIIEAMENDEDAANPLDDGDEENELDNRLVEAVDMVISDGQASISMLQRRMKIGYARAGRLVDDMAARGIVSKSAGSKPRDVLMSREEYEKIRDTLCS
ncbi:MAG: DNA translocase FtsK, partial [Clostridia bacterium]